MYTPCFDSPDTWVSRSKKDIEIAKAGCNRCPIKEKCLAECLEYEAMAGENKVGTYGGLSVYDRRNLKKKGVNA